MKIVKQALGKTGKSPVFPLNPRKLFQKAEVLEQSPLMG
jgi:hypothetical protein